MRERRISSSVGNGMPSSTVKDRRQPDYTSRLRFETLEQRILLSSEAVVDYAYVSPSWFAAVEAVDADTQEAVVVGLESASLFSTTAPDHSSSMDWIVRLTETAWAEVDSVTDTARLFDEMDVAVELVRGLGLPGQLLIRVRETDESIVRAGLMANPHLASYEPDQRLAGTSDVDTETPNDPRFDEQFALKVIDAEEAWGVTTGSRDIVVGVIDSGADYTHPDLRSNIWLNQGEISEPLANALTDVDGDTRFTFADLNDSVNMNSCTISVTQNECVRDFNDNGVIDAGDLLEDPQWSDGLDTDGNGFVDDLFGWDFRSANSSPWDDHGHGTHVAGTIGAQGNNVEGIAGVNWDSSIMVLKFLDENNTGHTSNAIAAVNYATMMRTEFGVNVRVTNNSWGTLGEFSAALFDAIQASRDADILFVAAAGNGNILGQGINLDQEPFYPASYDLENIIAVAASDKEDNLVPFSNFGSDTVDIAAPGVGILNAAPDKKYISRNGTSMATPHVAGVAALVFANMPDATALEVRSAILEGADKENLELSGKVTNGRLNAHGALTAHTFGPRATLLYAPDIIVEGAGTQTIIVKHQDNEGVDLTSLDDMDLTVVREGFEAMEFGLRLLELEIPTLVVDANATNHVLAAARNIDGERWTTAEDPNVTDSTELPHLSIESTVVAEAFDYYEFTVVNAGDRGIFDIDFGTSGEMMSDSTDIDTALFLYDSSGGLLADNDNRLSEPDAGSSNAHDSFINHVFAEVGTYVIGVGRSGSEGSQFGITGAAPQPGQTYTLHVSVENHPFTFVVDKDATNNVFATARIIDDEHWTKSENPNIFDSTVIPHISIKSTAVEEAFDYYEFTVENAGDTGIFDIDFGKSDDTSSIDTELFLYDSSGSLLANNDDRLGGPDAGSTVTADSHIKHAFAEAGTYVIGVGRFNSEGSQFGITGAAPQPGQTYTLHVSVENHLVNILPVVQPLVDVKATNNVLAAAIDLELEKERWTKDENPNIIASTVIPHISIESTAVEEAFDYYQFTIENAKDRGIFDIDFGESDDTSSIDSIDTELFLYDSSGHLLTFNDDRSGEPDAGSAALGDSHIDYTFDSPGIYVIGVGRYSSKGELFGITGDAPRTGQTYTLHVSVENHDYFVAAVAPEVIAKYKLTKKSAGDWSAIDNGSYTISLGTNQVIDIGGITSPAKELGTFNVTIQDPMVFFVNSTFDTVDEVLNDNKPADKNGMISLRTAIQHSMHLNGGHTIVVPDGSYVLTLAGPDENESVTGDLDITHQLTILGGGSDRTIIDADQLDRVFDVHGSGYRFTLKGVTVTGGNVDEDAGDLQVDFENASGSGGGLRNHGAMVIIEQSVITNNRALNNGGGIFNANSMFIEDSTVSNNSTTAVLANGGGGIYNSGALTLTASTVFGNITEAGFVDNGGGGGLFNEGDDKSSIVNSTFSGNIANRGDGGAIFHLTGELSLMNSTITANQAFVGSAGGIFTASGSIVPLEFNTQFGSNGRPLGELDQPRAVTVGNSGNVYVVDFGNDRIQVFDETFVPLMAIGESGTEDGQFNGLRDVATDASGRIYVTDEFNHRIQVFDGSGMFFDTFGAYGSNDKQFIQPRGIFVDDEDHIYVADYLNSRIQVFDENRDFLWQIKTEGRPLDVAVDSSGRIYVVHSVSGYSGIEVFDKHETTWERSHISLLPRQANSSPEEAWSALTGIAVDHLDRIIVADFDRIQIVPQSGIVSEISTISTKVEDVAVDAVGRIYAADGNHRVAVFVDSNGSSVADPVFIGDPSTAGQSPREITVDQSGRVYVADLAFDRIQVFNGPYVVDVEATNNVLDAAIDLELEKARWTRDEDSNITDSTVIPHISIKTTAVAEAFDYYKFEVKNVGDRGIFDIDFGKSGDENSIDTELFLYDSFGSRVAKNDDRWGGLDPGSAVNKDSFIDHVFAESGIYVIGVGRYQSHGEAFGITGDAPRPGQTYTLHVSVENHDFQSGPIVISDEPFLEFGKYGTSDREFDDPQGVAVDDRGHIYVADRGNDRVQIFDRSGAHLRSFGTFGTGDGEFNKPYGIAIANNGRIYVADELNHRIHVFDNFGVFLYKFGGYGSEPGQLKYPRGVAISEFSNEIYVADFGNNRVQVFDLSGLFLEEIQGFEKGFGPQGVVVDHSYPFNLYVTNAHRISVVAVGMESPSLTDIPQDTPLPVPDSTENSTLVTELIDRPLIDFSGVDGIEFGIAITGTNISGGTLRYSTDGGTTWADVGSVSPVSARVLWADLHTRLHFQPAAGYHGTLSDVVTFKAWRREGGFDNGQSEVNTTAGLLDMYDDSRSPSDVILSPTDNMVYVADQSDGLQIFAVTPTGKVILLGHYDVAAARSVTLSSDGKTAYVASDESGLHIIDVSTPNNPRLLSTYDTGGAAWDVTVTSDGKTAFVADRSNGLQIIDVSTPNNPLLLPTYNTSGSAWGVTVSSDGKTAYVADGLSGLQIIDVSTPASPELLGTYDTSGSAWGVTLSSDGTIAYVADSNSGLQIIDVSMPTSPELLGTYDTSGHVLDVTLSPAGTKAYVADHSGLQIIDVSTPASPELLGTRDTNGSAVGVTLSSDGTIVYVADLGSGLQIIEPTPNEFSVSSYTASVMITEVDAPAVHDVTLSRSFSYHFGTIGRGEGNFIQTRGVVVDDAGNVYVTDQKTDRVQVFMPLAGVRAGVFVRNSIISGNDSLGLPDVIGNFTSEGHNLIGVGSSHFLNSDNMTFSTEVVSSNLDVSGVWDAVQDVNLTLSLQHEEFGGLEALLKSPAGTTVPIFYAGDINGTGFVETTFDDDADVAIREGSLPYAGKFSPFGTLSTFDGEDANGRWTLELDGTNQSGSGILLGWSINLSTASGFTDGDNGDLVGSETNPIDPRLDILSDNGGPTLSHELLPGSPAIDAGTEDRAPSVDQRGVTRPVDANNDNYAQSDIGAVERIWGEVQGTHFLDVDGDGKRGLNEPGLAGWTVFADLNQNGQHDAGERAAVTEHDDPNTLAVNESGSYRIQRLEAGNYVIAKKPQNGFEHTFPQVVGSGARIQFNKVIEMNKYEGLLGSQPSIVGDQVIFWHNDAIVQSSIGELDSWIELINNETELPRGSNDEAYVALFDSPPFQDGRQVGFTGRHKEDVVFTDADSVFLVDVNGTIIRVAEETEGGFTSLGSVRAVSDGVVVFDGVKSAVPSGLYVGDGVSPIVTLVNTNIPSPSDYFLFDNFLNNDIDLDGLEYAFIGESELGTRGIYVGESPTTLQTVIEFSPCVPDISGNCPDGNFTEVFAFALAEGEVAFYAQKDRITNDNLESEVAIYRGSNPASLVKIVDGDTEVPNDGSHAFVVDGTDELKIAWDGEAVVFSGSSSSGRKGIYTDLDGSLRKVIDTQDYRLLENKGIQGLSIGRDSLSGNRIVFHVDFYPTELHLPSSSAIYVAEFEADQNHTVELKVGEVTSNIDFGSHAKPGEIRGQAFKDLDSDGEKDINEPGLEGWTIYLDQNNNSVVDTNERSVVTDADGKYIFSNLATPANYRVAEEVPAGWAQTSFDLSVAVKWNLLLNPGEVASNVDFGNQLASSSSGVEGVNNSGSISGQVVDFNSLKDFPLQDRTVYIDENENGVMDDGERSTLTSRDGAYVFDGLTVGKKVIRVAPDPAEFVVAPLGNRLIEKIIQDGLGTGPQRVVLEDFNGDGKLDLAVANGSPLANGTTNEVSILVNDGSAAFFSPVANNSLTSAGIGPRGIATGDFDGDGKPDLAVVYYTNSKLSVFGNLGNNKFAAPETFSVGSAPSSIISGHFDADDFLDLAVTSEFEDQLLILKNDGPDNFGFTESQRIQVGKRPTSVAAGNLNNDNHLDLVVTNTWDGTVTVLENGAENSNRFTTRSTLNVGIGPFFVTISDLDKVGQDDIIVANVMSDNLSILLNNNNNDFTFNLNNLAAGVGPSSVAAVDVDKDGDQDLAISNLSASRNLSLMRNNGDGTFAPAENFGAGQFEDSAGFSVVAADLNDDSLPDFVLTRAKENAVSVFENQLTSGSHLISLVGELLDGQHPVIGNDFSIQRGDFNDDREVNDNDIESLFEALNVVSAGDQYDLNNDSSVDRRDMGYLVTTILQRMFGDTDLDEDVGLADFRLVKDNFRPQLEGAHELWEDGNSDGDRDIDFTDLFKVILNYTGQESTGSEGTADMEGNASIASRIAQPDSSNGDTALVPAAENDGAYADLNPDGKVIQEKVRVSRRRADRALRPHSDLPRQRPGSYGVRDVSFDPMMVSNFFDDNPLRSRRLTKSSVVTKDLDGPSLETALDLISRQVVRNSEETRRTRR